MLRGFGLVQTIFRENEKSGMQIDTDLFRVFILSTQEQETV